MSRTTKIEVGPYELIDSEYHAYDECAPEVYARLKAAVSARLPTVGLEHTGSTAVPGTAGKNVIDLLVVSERERFKELLEGLSDLGFQESPFEDVPKDRPLRVGSVNYRDRRYLVHVHAAVRGSEDEKNILFFRDYLRAHPAVAQEYAAIKERAVGAGRVGATEYNREKSTFIRNILNKARFDELLD